MVAHTAAQRTHGEIREIRAAVFVGRVKSTAAPSLLEEAFSKVGKLSRVETGFAGFAFVEFADADDADTACQKMKQAVIPGIGEVRVEPATTRGYQDACTKREDYMRSRWGTGWPNPRSPSWNQRRDGIAGRSRSPCGSRSPSKSRWRSLSNSGGRRRSRSWRSHKSVSRSRSLRRPQLRSQQHQQHQQQQTRSASPSLERDAGNTANSDALGLLDLDVEDSGVHLEPSRRAATVGFFDGANACDLLLEGSAPAKALDTNLSSMLSDFPHGFQALSQEDAMHLHSVVSGFLNADGKGSIELLQTLVVDIDGQRSAQKALLVNGIVLCTEEREI